MKRHLQKTLIFILIFCSKIYGQEIDLANAYYHQGEYLKAAELYKKFNFNKFDIAEVHQNYLDALYKLKNYEEAEKFIKNQIRINAYNVVYKAEYAEYLDITEKPELSEKEYERVIEFAVNNKSAFFELHNYFYKVRKYEKVVDLIQASRIKSKNPSEFDTLLAQAYLFLGMKDKMLEELLNYGPKERNFSYVEAVIQDSFKEEDEIELLEKTLYDRIQKFPDETFYSELLIWHYTQRSEYARAFIQAKALDKRLKLEGMKIFELASLSFGNDDFKNAAKMYKYILDEYPGSDLSMAARRWYIQSKEEIVKNTFPINKDDIRDIISQYESMVAEMGLNAKTAESMRNMALLNAFYLDNIDKAVKILENAIKLSETNITFRDQCKLDLGDIYILKNEPWEATLLYMQVEKSEKENNLGENAKLKNARLQYFDGDFELAKEILDILKKATTREIANDAMQLSLLIDDNTGLDSTETALKEYAQVDLLLYQNKYTEGIEQLTKLYDKYKTHSLADEILWLRANTNVKINNLDAAVKDLEIITQNYKTDILADDALFLLAKITEENFKDKPKAMEYYRNILKEYPGSVFCAQARIRFRELRGDFVN